MICEEEFVFGSIRRRNEGSAGSRSIWDLHLGPWPAAIHFVNRKDWNLNWSAGTSFNFCEGNEGYLRC